MHVATRKRLIKSAFLYSNFFKITLYLNQNKMADDFSVSVPNLSRLLSGNKVILERTETCVGKSIPF